MTSCNSVSYPVFYHWCSIPHPNQIYLIKQTDSNTIQFGVYKIALTRLNKEPVQMDSIQLPPNIGLPTNPDAVVAHLVARQVIGAGDAPPNAVSGTTSTGSLQKAIDVYRLKAAVNSEHLEQFICPLTGEIVINPVTDEYGHTYEDKVIRAHLKQPHAVSPRNGLPIKNLEPNLYIKKQLDKLRAENPILDFTQFESNSLWFAQLYAGKARVCFAAEEYEKAFEHCASMLQFTKDPEFYKIVVTFYDKIDLNKAVLSRLYLANYLLEADQVDAACQTLEEAHSKVKGDIVKGDIVKGNIKIIKALMELYLDRKEFDKAILLLEDNVPLLEDNVPDSDYLKRQFKTLCYRVLAQDQTNYVRLYNLLALCTKDPQNVLLEAACAALQKKQYETALKFCERIDLSDPSIDNLLSFTDHFRHLNALVCMDCHTDSLSVLHDLAENYSLSQKRLKEIEVREQIAYRDPNSREIFADVIQGYQELGELKKLPRCYSKWLSHLIAQENWEKAEAVVLEAEKLIKEPQMRSLEEDQQMHLLEQVIDSLKEMKKRGLSVPIGVFGRTQWEKYYGAAVDGDDPPFPEDIDKILKAPCPFNPAEPVWRTQDLVRIPKEVNGELFTLDSLGKMIENPKIGPRTTYAWYDEKLKKQIGQQSPAKSYWVLMSKGVVAGTKDIFWYTEQCAALNEKCSSQPYGPPSVLEAATVTLIRYVQKNRCELGQDPWTFTQCRERIGNFQGGVGGLGPDGIGIGICDSDYSTVEDFGLAAVRRLEDRDLLKSYQLNSNLYSVKQFSRV